MQIPTMNERPMTWVPMMLREGYYADFDHADPAIQPILGAARAARDAGEAILGAYQARQRDEMSSPAQRQAAAEAYAKKKMTAVTPLVAAALKKADTAAAQIDAEISESLYSIASKWPFAAEARALVLATPAGTERTALVRKLMVTDALATAAILGAPATVSGLEPAVHERERTNYIAMAYPEETQRAAAIRSAATHLANGARLLEGKVSGLFDRSLIDHAAKTRAAAEAAESK